jgi:thiamine-phosphate pyrophosphorylase
VYAGGHGRCAAVSDPWRARRYHQRMNPVARMIDANANRAREALRVMEDAARFGLDDGELSGLLKQLRHDLRAALDRLPSGWLEANRDAPGDVGAALSTDSEGVRAGLHDVVAAAGKRAAEALRVIEETAKTLDPALAESVQRLRYRTYDLDGRLRLRAGTGRARQWRLCLLLTEALCRRPWMDVLSAALDGGADCIQVREKTMDGGALARRVDEVIRLARRRGGAVVVNDRTDVALAAGADGVHVGQRDLSVRQVRAIAGTALLVGVSTHDLDEARAAVEAGADSCGVGAMFATDLKPDRAPCGTAFLRAFIDRHPTTPHLAIGGITPDNLPQLVEAGARGVAVCSVVCGAEHPARVVAALRAALDRAHDPVPGSSGETQRSACAIA